ncbi:hypothetical protein [Poseidonibacter ostreae]|uniref:Conjugal transfer protein TraN n=1 Tax=Poseidonibacter ostreae TaxID=2654171 RepID=A0A6L4WTW6_9BACT|nr:hypothetical protein [Poseidonibacter ostreae]KAB7889568.1 hypothetical protein GBG19_05795 [Poseidonibacter ostreae]
MKKFISLFLVAILATSLSANTISEVCEDTGTEEYFPIADERGNLILTKKEFNRTCTLTTKVQGACIKWETIKENFVIEAEDYDAYRSQNHESGMGSLLAMIGAYDQLEHLWSGWKGYCEIGTKTNFDWASDPMFWAGLVASAIMDGSQAGDVAGAQEAGLKASTDVTSTAYKTAYESSIKSTQGFMADTAIGQGVQSAQSTVGSWAGSTLGTWVGNAAGKCLLASGFDMANNLYQYAGNDNADDMCDPVDEFCGSTEDQTQESDITTIDKQQYLDMIEQHPDFTQYIIVLGEEEGIMSVRFKNLNEVEGMENADQAQLDEMMEQLKNIELAVSVVMTTAKLGACMATDANISSSVETSSSSSDDDNPISLKAGAGMAISAIPAEWLGPYGVLVKAALQVLLNFATSFPSIDSCHDQDDADEQGDRHAKTAESLPHDLCYFVYDKCVDNCGDAFLGLAKELRGYNYCCYDQILTKVLVIQLKAQLGRDWSHCTGISLRDLNYVSFKQCTADQMADGINGGDEGLGNIGGGDTVKPPEEGGYDPQTTFQYKHKCIDLTEFKDYLKAQIGEDIDLSDFDSIFEDVENQANNL